MELATTTFVDLARHHAQTRADQIFLRWLADGRTQSHSFTYASLDQRAQALAVQIRLALPPSTHDRAPAALIITGHGPDFALAFFACMYAGVIAVPAYPPKKGEPAQRLFAVLDSSGASLVLTGGATLSVEYREQLSLRAQLLPVDVTAQADARAWNMPDIDGRSVAFVQYTSGSTGSPKGVVVTHANLLSNQRMIQRGMQTGPDTVALGWLPLFHDMGLIGNLLQSFYLGAELILMSPSTFVTRPILWLQAISDFRATHSGGPNFAYDLCVARTTPEQRQRLDLSSWKLAFSGAEPVRAATLRRFHEAFAASGFDDKAFFPCYGMAESTLFVTGADTRRAPTLLSVDRDALSRGILDVHDSLDATSRQDLVGCGTTAEGCLVRIVDPVSRQVLPDDTVGEIWIYGPNVAQGYAGQPALTKDTFHATLADDESGLRFLRSGDLGVIHRGELFVTGRSKDLIIINGKNHYPQDIELSALESHPLLLAGTAAAFAIEGGDDSERPVLVVGLVKPQLPLAELARAITRAVTRSHAIELYDLVIVAERLPTTSSNKIRRAACRELYGKNGFTRTLLSTRLLREQSDSRSKGPEAP